MKDSSKSHVELMMDFKKFKEAGEESEYKIRSYSGRAMYGRTCVGIEFSRYESAGTVVFKICQGLVDIGETLDDYYEVFEGTREDSMGLDSIVYFPRLKWEESEDIEDIIEQLAEDGFRVFDTNDAWFWEPEGCPEDAEGPFETKEEAVENCVENRDQLKNHE